MDEYNLEQNCETGEFTGRRTVTVGDTSITAMGRGDCPDDVIRQIDSEILKAGGDVS